MNKIKVTKWFTPGTEKLCLAGNKEDTEPEAREYFLDDWDEIKFI